MGGKQIPISIIKKVNAMKKSKPKKNKKLSFDKIEKSPVQKFRDKWLKKGYDLVNITSLCEAKIGDSGWCNELNEPDEHIHHIQMIYRDECIVNVTGDMVYPIDDDRFVVFQDEPDHMGRDFIIFRKVKL